MHVGDGSQDANALPQMIEDLQAQGFTFVTIEQLLQP
jgi:peptidoglycan/xylan/chitin deacetylase (PgdA/CDA1 family)